MIEIVFSDSAGGYLKSAMHYGRGAFRGAGHFSMMYYGVAAAAKDGKPVNLTEEQMEELRRQYEEKERIKWERAIPIGGQACDVFDFGLGLDTDDIRESGIPESRLTRMLEWEDRYTAPDDNWQLEYIEKQFRTMQKRYEEARSRALAGEPIRIWYSLLPYEFSGLYWFLAELESWDLPEPQVYAVEFPALNEEGEAWKTYEYGWGGAPEDLWGRTAVEQRLLMAEECQPMADLWHRLQAENAPLRVVEGRTLCSAPAEYYDPQIFEVLDHMEKDEFTAGQLAGRVMERVSARYDWIERRIDALIEKGLLEVTAPPPEDDMRPVRRMLRRK